MRNNLVAAFQYLKGSYREDRARVLGDAQAKRQEITLGCYGNKNWICGKKYQQREGLSARIGF